MYSRDLSAFYPVKKSYMNQS